MGRVSCLVLLRALCVLASASLVTLALWCLAATSVVDLRRELLTDDPGSLTELSFDEALIGICSVTLIAAGAWIALVTALLVTEVVVQSISVESAGARGIPRMTARICPRVTQRIVLAGCGVALTAALASPATADQSGRLAGLAVPDRTVGSPVSEPGPARITVTAGSSLWAIAKAALDHQPAHPPGDPEITVAWHAIHRANADRIGNDPDLIFPGTTLQIPDLNEPDRKDHQ